MSRDRTDDPEGGRIMDFKLELVLVPVRDVDRAKACCAVGVAMG
jgi:hypothetical protein